MMLRYPIISLACLCLFLGKLCAESAAGVMVKVRTPYQNFSQRLEVQLKDKIDSHQKFDLMNSPKFGSHQAIVEIDVKYPVYAFPQQETFYVKLTGLPKGERYLCLSIPARGKGKLTLEEEGVLSKDLIAKVVMQLEREFANGPYLQPGYFSNKAQLNLERELLVELMGPKTKKVLIQDLEDLPDTSMVKPIQKSQPITIKEEETKRVAKIDQKSEDSKPTWKPKAERVKDLKAHLKMTWKGPRRAALLRELALIHLEEDLKEDALAYALKAYEDDPSEENFQLIRDLETNEMYPVDRFRFNNRIRNLDLSFLLKTEYDTNVVQDPVDSVSHTDSNDLLIQAAFLVDKKWGFKIAGMEQYTTYDFSQSFYAEEQDLDLMTHRLGYDMSKSFKSSRLDFGIGYNYFVRRGKSLLDGMDLNLSYSFFVKEYDQVYKTSFVWLDKSYTDHFYNSGIYSGEQSKIDFNWSGSLIEGQRLIFEVGFLQDDLNDTTISYGSASTGVHYQFSVDSILISTITPSFRYHRRKYDDAQPGRNKRKDARFTYGLQSVKRIGDHQNINVNMIYTDHQSSRRVNKYKRTQVSLGYQIDF